MADWTDIFLEAHPTTQHRSSDSLMAPTTVPKTAVRAIEVAPFSGHKYFPFWPSSEASRSRGCTCPEQREWPKRLMVSVDCRLHRDLEAK